MGEITDNIFYRAPLRSPQPLASLQVGRQAPRHGLVRYSPTLPQPLLNLTSQVSLEWSPLIGWSSGFKDGGGRGKAEFHQVAQTFACLLYWCLDMHWYLSLGSKDKESQIECA